jgi:intraflagellar transport protein 172
MKLTHAATVLPHVDGICKVTALAWSPNNRKLAAVTVDRIVHLFDETGERRDRFTTKPNDKGGNAGPKNYIVRSMAFSPDSDRLAIAQSDNVVFVYKVGLDWDKDYKKKIVNKIFQSSPVTCLIWPAKHPMKCIFGLADGKVKVAMLERNKAATLFASDSYVVSCCPSPDGHGVLTGHLNCAVYRCLLEDGGGGGGLVVGQLFTHSTVPYALAWGQSIVAAGADGNVSFYHCTGADQGTLQRNFDYTSDESVKEFGCAVCAPSGRSVVVGNYNKSFVYSFNQATQTWDEAGVREVENLLSVTALAWKQDGSRLALGALCGVVDLYDACLRRVRYRGLFEFTYVSLSEVIIKTLSSGATVAVGSKCNSEISAVDIYHERFVVARTGQTLIVGDLGDPKLGGGVDRLRISEFTWGGGGDEKFFFENEAVCMCVGGERPQCPGLGGEAAPLPLRRTPPRERVHADARFPLPPSLPPPAGFSTTANSFSSSTAATTRWRRAAQSTSRKAWCRCVSTSASGATSWTASVRTK